MPVPIHRVFERVCERVAQILRAGLELCLGVEYSCMIEQDAEGIQNTSGVYLSVVFYTA